MQELGGVKVVVRGPIKVLGQVLVSTGVGMTPLKVDVGIAATVEVIVKEESERNCRKRQHQEMNEWNK